ncbi:MAG: hypothetical protein KUA43_09715 [Hoeflea sp.]|uniref:hypothetical protein n=1 Tax=Hoeflea sp. TaxID=1940281 RepID=UPI001D99016A|nr:hypothetical protein [Hoeflea sp.]MBU4528452.1 hypothetical protein [Alphaproteobacteria bacterium]MBU4543121.1 hypothetical protein [Alphaproteobacteria bacterium]MBU4551812.1 hypothetical protein [Alphaproteobacteria bacterium]MBV1723707.1 hypothetical protein [Hoeflea sp.]MBV1762023.1 hypothetical protein [Hoeflea sp.]
MTNDSLKTSKRRPVAWYEEVIPVRGCKLSMGNIKDFYRDLSAINRKFGEQVISGLPRNDAMSDEEWNSHKSTLLDDAFCLTITINGIRDQKLYGESLEIFDDIELPKPIESIFFTNNNSF